MKLFQLKPGEECVSIHIDAPIVTGFLVSFGVCVGWALANVLLQAAVQFVSVILHYIRP